MPSITLTDAELLLLDGKCSEKVQHEVDKAKIRVSQVENLSDINPKYASFIGDVICEINSNRKLVLKNAHIRFCTICSKSGGYAVYPRSSRYHHKGDRNLNKPLYLPAVELAERFVTFTGSVYLGCCVDCWKELKPYLISQIKDMKAELSERITGYPSKYVKAYHRKCTVCDWKGNETELRKLPTLMGNGSYAGGCPNCPAENKLFQNQIDHLKEFDLVEVKPTKIQGE